MVCRVERKVGWAVGRLVEWLGGPYSCIRVTGGYLYVHRLSASLSVSSEALLPQGPPTCFACAVLAPRSSLSRIVSGMKGTPS